MFKKILILAVTIFLSITATPIMADSSTDLFAIAKDGTIYSKAISDESIVTGTIYETGISGITFKKSKDDSITLIFDSADDSTISVSYINIYRNTNIIIKDNLELTRSSNPAIDTYNDAKVYLSIENGKSISIPNNGAKVYKGSYKIFSYNYKSRFNDDFEFDSNLTYDSNGKILNKEGGTVIATLNSSFDNLKEFNGTLTKLNDSHGDDGTYTSTSGYIHTNKVVDTVSYDGIDTYTVTVNKSNATQYNLYVELLFKKSEYGKIISSYFIDPSTKEVISNPSTDYDIDLPSNVKGSLYKDADNNEYMSYFVSMCPVKQDASGNYLYPAFSMKIVDGDGVVKYINVINKTEETPTTPVVPENNPETPVTPENTPETPTTPENTPENNPEPVVDNGGGDDNDDGPSYDTPVYIVPNTSVR